MAAVLTAACAAVGAEAPVKGASRGFGEVTMSRAAANGVETTEFKCADAATAARMASKRKADLLAFGDLRELPGESCGTVLRLEGVGCWLLGVRGAVFCEAFASDVAALRKAFAGKGFAKAADGAYPAWMDCFDIGGPAVWVGGGGDNFDVPGDFEWLKRNGLAFCTCNPTQSRLVAPGVVDWSIFDWQDKMAEKYGLRYRQLLFPSTFPWSWNLKPLPYVKPVKGFMPLAGFYDPELQLAGGETPVAETDPYRWRLRQLIAERFGGDKSRLMGYHGCTEIPNASVNDLAAIAETPQVKALWRARGGAGDVPVPTDFIGWDPAADLDLAGGWSARVGRDGAAPRADWTPVAANDPIFFFYCGNRHDASSQRRHSTLFRRTFTVPAGADVARYRYLHTAVATYHGAHTELPTVWVNGVEATAVCPEAGFSHCADVSKGLRAGENEIVVDMHGHPMPGYAFLNATPLRKYPYMTERENRRWFEAVEFATAVRVQKIREDLEAVRAVDPVRPLKLMATLNFLDVTTGLCRELGAYHHDTGAAAGFWCPCTGARLARSHGHAWSCEQGGPPKTEDEIRRDITYYLNYGNDAADLVFAVPHYTKNEAVRKWIEGNMELVKAIGKLHMPRQKVAVLRSSRAVRMGFDDPWNFDWGRGTVQQCGFNFEYLETCDLADAELLARYPLILDSGTVLMTAEDCAAVRRYVEAGGTFVAQRQTGLHLPERAEARPLLAAFGLAPSGQGRQRVGFGKGFFVYLNDAYAFYGTNWILDETGRLGLRPDFTPSGANMWGTAFESKNGVYDVYMPTRMEGPAGVPPVKASPAFARANAPRGAVRDFGVAGHPEVASSWADGTLTLPEEDYVRMQTRLYAAVSCDPGGAAARWFRNWCEIWHPVRRVARRAAKPERDPDVIELGGDWEIASAGETPRKGRAGLFGTLGYPEDARVSFRRTVELPEDWRDRPVRLSFDCTYWFWGLSPSCTLTVDGERPEGLKQPILPSPSGAFTVDVTRFARDGRLEIALEIDGAADRRAGGFQSIPHGVSGIFCLRRGKAPLARHPIAGPWFAATDFGVLQPVEIGASARHLWYETRFETPVSARGNRLYLRGGVPLMGVVLNGQVLQLPSCMDELDVTGLLAPVGAGNVIRWTRENFEGRSDSAGRFLSDTLEPLEIIEVAGVESERKKGNGK